MAPARRVVVLALVMFAIIGLSYAAAEAPRPAEDDYEEDDSEFLIGTRSGDAPSPNSVVAGPIGGPVPPGAFKSTPATPPSAASSLHHLSVVAGTAAAATAAFAGFFYF